MKDFDKMMEELKEKLSGLDDKIAEQVNAACKEMGAAFKVYKDFYDHENGEDGDGKSQTFVFHTPKNKKRSRHNSFNFSFSDTHEKPADKDDKFVKMAPYLDEESLHELTVEFCDSDLETDMAAILPYLSDEDLLLILNKIEENEEFKYLREEDLFPYIDEKYIDELFLKKFSKGIIDEEMFSFVSDECWHNIVLKYCEDENSDIDIDAIYPFLNDEDINLLFKNYLKRRKSKKE